LWAVRQPVSWRPPLLLLPAAEGRSVPLNIAAVFLALSVLAKGLLPLILLLPFFWFARAGWRKWLSPRPVFVFCLIALPWYILCQLRNPQFFDVFFVQQQFGRFTSPDLQHVQPFWFYLPVLAGALFPSTFLGVFALWPRMYQDQRRKLLGVVVLFGFVFLSAARNKLPGYILPLLPAVCVLIACGIDAARVLHPRLLGVVLALSALTIPGFVVAAGILPLAVNGGLRHAVSLDGTTSTRIWTAIPLGLLAAGCLYFLTRDFLTRAKAMMLWFTLAAGGWIYMEYSALPGLDLTSSARSLWRDLPDPKRDFCVGPVGRNWRYGLNYYSVFPLKDCAGNEKLAIRPGPSPSGRPLF
jgi:4-amino-4-deoxy-L-arabinose transferase-like glycosyltransferase